MNAAHWMKDQDVRVETTDEGESSDAGGDEVGRVWEREWERVCRTWL